tara:strand:+ start:249 stop:833 length:585 start_codon:yes stop_codon:yes gene_type:complete
MSKLKLNAASGGGSVSFEGPASSGSDKVIKFPAAPGVIVQTITTVKTDTSSWAFDTSSNSWKETGLQAVITPTVASNKILIWVSGMYGGSVNGENIYWAFSRSSDSSNFQIGDTSGSRTRVTTGSFLDSTSRPAQFSVFAVDSNHNTTSANTYKLLATGNNQAGTMYLNRTSSDDDGWYRPRGTTTMILQEVAT